MACVEGAAQHLKLLSGLMNVGQALSALNLHGVATVVSRCESHGYTACVTCLTADA